MTAKTLWDECLLKVRSQISADEFNKWFPYVKPVSLEESQFTIEVPTEFFKEYFDKNFCDILRKALVDFLGTGARLYYKISQFAAQTKVTYPAQSSVSPANKPFYDPATTINPNLLPGLVSQKINSQLDPECSFENFVVGDCNKMAYVASEVIYKNPGKSGFNPLFIFGASGLGKTHICHAVGLKVKEKYPDLRVLYVSANNFKLQYMDATNLQNNKLADFLAFYMKIDVLIVDDIQDLTSPGSQNAFFQIFNHLHQIGKQLIFTSDRPQVELDKFEDRLLSRFKWGLSVELKKPSYETRLGMLNNFCQRKGMTFSNEILEYIAHNVQTNFRDLQGILNSLLMQSIVMRSEVTLEEVQRIIHQIVGDNGLNISIEKVQAEVCRYFGLTLEELISASRKGKIVSARQICMYICRELTASPLTMIGKAMGGKDHSTVLHSCTTVSDRMSTDREYRNQVREIERNLQ